MASKPVFQAQSTPQDSLQATIHEMTGKFVGLPECYEFLEEARGMVDEKHPSAILQMSGVSIINSTGIGLIAALLTSVKNRGGKLILVGLSDLTCRQLEVTHLLQFITVVDSMDKAAEAVG